MCVNAHAWWNFPKGLHLMRKHEATSFITTLSVVERFHWVSSLAGFQCGWHWLHIRFSIQIRASKQDGSWRHTASRSKIHQSFTPLLGTSKLRSVKHVCTKYSQLNQCVFYLTAGDRGLIREESYTYSIPKLHDDVYAQRQVRVWTGSVWSRMLI